MKTNSSSSLTYACGVYSYISPPPLSIPNNILIYSTCPHVSPNYISIYFFGLFLTPNFPISLYPYCTYLFEYSAIITSLDMCSNHFHFPTMLITLKLPIILLYLSDLVTLHTPVLTYSFQQLIIFNARIHRFNSQLFDFNLKKKFNILVFSILIWLDSLLKSRAYREPR